MSSNCIVDVRMIFISLLWAAYFVKASEFDSFTFARQGNLTFLLMSFSYHTFFQLQLIVLTSEIAVLLMQKLVCLLIFLFMRSSHNPMSCEENVFSSFFTFKYFMKYC